MSTSPIQQPIALITGASRGLGASIAKNLAKKGYFTLINYVSNEGLAQNVLNEIQNAGGKGALVRFDVAKSDELEKSLDQALKDYGPIELLVNNAGITRDNLLLRAKDSEFQEVLDTNLKGAMTCTRVVSRAMLRARKGSIIFIASVVGERGSPGQGAYCAAKAGMIGFCKSVALELASRNIRCNVVSPGFIRTDMTEALTETQKAAILQSIPLGTYGEPEDVAEAVAYLASPQARYITGQVLGVNGGMYM